MWNGVFDIPEVVKHRDYRHSSYYQHAKATGDVEVGAAVAVAVDPIAQEALDEVSPYYEVYVTTHDNKTYTYLIESDTPGPPSEEEIEDQLNEYIKKPVEGGRRLEDYIADIEVEGIETQEVQLNYTGRFMLSQVLAAIEAA